MREKIVFMEMSGLGNLILATPMLKAIRQTKPTAEIIVLAWNRSVRIIEGIDFVDLTLCVEQQNLVHNFVPHIDHLLISPVGAIVQVAEALKNLSKNVYQVNVGPVWGKHEAEFKLDLAKKLGYKGALPGTEIKVFDYNIKNIESWRKTVGLNDNFICINAAYLKDGHWSLKHWGNNNFSELINCINKEIGKHQFVIIGSQDDFDDAEDIIKACNDIDILNVCGVFQDVKDSAALINKSKLMVGNDGGLMHIAAALDIPTITIFTFTNPIKNRPISNKGRLVFNPCNDRIKCQHGHWQNCQIRGCLNVSVEKVLKIIKEIIC